MSKKCCLLPWRMKESIRKSFGNDDTFTLLHYWTSWRPETPFFFFFFFLNSTGRVWVIFKLDLIISSPVKSHSIIFQVGHSLITQWVWPSYLYFAKLGMHRAFFSSQFFVFKALNVWQKPWLVAHPSTKQHRRHK